MPWRDILNQLANEPTAQTIFVAGFGGAGKTTFCTAFAQSSGIAVTLLSLDWWLSQTTQNRKRELRLLRENGDSTRLTEKENPKNWYDYAALESDLKTLLATNRLCLRGAWNQNNGQKDLAVDLVIPDRPPRLVIVEGIFLLHKPLCELADARLMLSADPHQARLRSEQRDSHRNAPDYLSYKKFLLDTYEIPYFDHNQQNADAVIDDSLED